MWIHEYDEKLIFFLFENKIKKKRKLEDYLHWTYEGLDLLKYTVSKIVRSIKRNEYLSDSHYSKTRKLSRNTILHLQWMLNDKNNEKKKITQPSHSFITLSHSFYFNISIKKNQEKSETTRKPFSNIFVSLIRISNHIGLYNLIITPQWQSVFIAGHEEEKEEEKEEE